MGEKSLKSASLRTKGVLFAGLGSLIAIIFFVFLFFIKDRVSDEYTQRVSAIGTKLQLTENVFEELVSDLKNREVPSLDKVEALESDYTQLAADLQFINGNIFIYKEDSEGINSILSLISRRKEQIGTVRSLTNYLIYEVQVDELIKQHKSCQENINYKGDAAKIVSSLDECQILISASISDLREKEALLSCNDSLYPTDFLTKQIELDTLLLNFYRNIADKKYPEASADDKLYKQKQSELTTLGQWNACINTQLNSSIQTFAE